MKFDHHETDLYILPETSREKHNLQSFCMTKKWSYCWQYSNVKNQSWEGKVFLEIPFGIDFKNKIIKHMEVTK
jgi:hypothetical protein